MYGSFHRIWPVNPRVAPPKDYEAEIPGCEPSDVVGPICESGDLFAEQRPMPPVSPNDLVAFMTAGAYGAAMSSTYNTRPLAPEVLVKGGDFAVVRPRQTYDTLIGQDVVPAWL
jgi:diaminopimelate decarboxylase